MISDQDILREQGRISARQDALDSDIKEIQRKLDEVLEFVHETKGGHRMLWGLLAMASTLGAIVGSLVTLWRH